MDNLDKYKKLASNYDDAVCLASVSIVNVHIMEHKLICVSNDLLAEGLIYYLAKVVNSKGVITLITDDTEYYIEINMITYNNNGYIYRICDTCTDRVPVNHIKALIANLVV